MEFSRTRSTGDDDHEGWWVAQGFRGRQMNGVQRTDGFHGKWTTGAGEDRFSDAHDVATPGKSPEGEQRCPMLLGRDPPGEARAKNRSAGLGNRQSGCDPQ